MLDFYSDHFLPLVRPYGRRLQGRIDGWLADLAAREPLRPPGRAALAALVRARLGLVYSLEGLQGRVQFWQGAALESGCPLRVAYLGDRQAEKVASPRYLQHVLFQPGSLRAELGQACAMRECRSLAARLASNADLVIVEGSDLLRWRPSTGRWLWLPTWVRMAITFPDGQPWEAVQKGMRAHKMNIRRAERGGFTFRVSHDDADFDFFYERMHVPMMQERHGGYGVIDDKENARKLFRRGALFIASHEQQPAAAGLVHFHGQAAYGISNGILDGDQSWYARGALSMLYLHSIRWCHENGIRLYDVGGVRPFSSDGLYTYKLHWGMRPMPDRWLGRSWLFWSPGQSPEAVNWLRAHPPVEVAGVQASQNLLA